MSRPTIAWSDIRLLPPVNTFFANKCFCMKNHELPIDVVVPNELTNKLENIVSNISNANDMTFD